MQNRSAKDGPRPDTTRIEREIISFNRHGVEYASRCQKCGGEVQSAIRSARLVLICSAGCAWQSEPLVDHPGGIDQEAILRRIAALSLEPMARQQPLEQVNAPLVPLEEAFNWLDLA